MNVAATQKPPAEVYDEKFVPALFGAWGPVVAALSEVGPGDAVLDVGCGTGALTLAAARAAGPGAMIVGLDPNPEMLAVARRKPDAVEWREGRAEALPFADGTFDAVVSQFAMMFFDDRPQALREAMRVLKPGGRMAVAVCGAIERSPGYGAFAALLDRLFGRGVGDAFRAPFALGDQEELRRIARAAGIDAAVEERTGAVRFRSIDELVSTERACVWTLGGMLSDAQFEVLLRESEAALAPFGGANGPDGRGSPITFDMPALVVTARKTG